MSCFIKKRNRRLNCGKSVRYMRHCSTLNGNRQLWRHLWQGTASCDLLTGGLKNLSLPAPATISETCPPMAHATAPLLKDRYMRRNIPAAWSISRYRHLRHFDHLDDRHMRRHLWWSTATCDSGNRRLSLKTATGDVQIGGKSHRRGTNRPVPARAVWGMGNP